MITEGAFTRKLIAKLREHLPQAAIIKHCNPFHRGVPDFSITIDRRTWWYEVKKHGEQPEPIQEWHLKRMAGEVVTFNHDGKLAAVTPIAGFGFLSIDKLVEELVHRCLT